jgi:hypothetical protein
MYIFIFSPRSISLLKKFKFYFKNLFLLHLKTFCLSLDLNLNIETNFQKKLGLNSSQKVI